MDQANPQSSTLLQQGIAAARAKRKGEAYQLLRQVVMTDPRNSEAWLWLGAVAPTPQEQLQAFERVLAIDPTNEKAQTGRRWALGRVGGGTAAAPPPAPAAPSSGGGGISSQDMLNMFGSVPGATSSPPPAAPANSFSSQDMRGMFGGAPAAPPRPELPPPPASSGGRGSSDLLGMFSPPPAASPAAPPRTDNDPFARQSGSDFDLSTPQPFDASMFGAAPPVPPPPSSPLPPGAPGTPGGAEWRGYSDLQEPEAFNWDDPGLGLSMGEPASAAVPLPPGGVTVAPRSSDAYGTSSPSLFSDLDRDVQDARREETRPAEADLPPQPQAERRGVPPLLLLGAVALIVLLLLVGILSALTANKTITLGAVPGPEDTVRSFLSAHVRGLYTEASGFLVPALATEYRQTDSALRSGLPDPRQQRGLAARVAPLATADGTAEVYGFFTSTATPAPATLNPNPWTFTLEKRDTGWLITGITPP